jgi:hypothetical protein
MWLSKSCAASGIIMLVILISHPMLLCSFWINVSLGLIFGSVGLILVNKNYTNGWIILSSSLLLLIFNYPPLLKCEACCYFSKLLFSLLLILGSDTSSVKKIYSKFNRKIN